MIRKMKISQMCKQHFYEAEFMNGILLSVCHGLDLLDLFVRELLNLLDEKLFVGVSFADHDL